MTRERRRGPRLPTATPPPRLPSAQTRSIRALYRQPRTAPTYRIATKYSRAYRGGPRPRLGIVPPRPRPPLHPPPPQPPCWSGLVADSLTATAHGPAPYLRHIPAPLPSGHPLLSGSPAPSDTHQNSHLTASPRAEMAARHGDGISPCAEMKSRHTEVASRHGDAISARRDASSGGEHGELKLDAAAEQVEVHLG